MGSMWRAFFFAKTDLVRDLRPLALPCCSNDHEGAKSGGKRISLRKGEIWKQQSVQNSTSKQEFCVHVSFCRGVIGK